MTKRYLQRKHFCQLISISPRHISISKIEIHEYRTIKDCIIEFDVKKTTRITNIRGENGHGKTSLLEAMFWVLTGEIFGSRKASNIDTAILLGNAKITMHGMINGQTFFVCRSTKKNECQCMLDNEICNKSGEVLLFNLTSDVVYLILRISIFQSNSSFSEWLHMCHVGQFGIIDCFGEQYLSALDKFASNIRIEISHVESNLSKVKSEITNMERNIVNQPPSEAKKTLEEKQKQLKEEITKNTKIEKDLKRITELQNHIHDINKLKSAYQLLGENYDSNIIQHQYTTVSVRFNILYQFLVVELPQIVYWSVLDIVYFFYSGTSKEGTSCIG